MTKSKFTAETKDVLADLENRIKQFIEANKQFEKNNPITVKEQNKALESVLILIDQINETGGIKRASEWKNEEGRDRSIPDGLEEMIVYNKWRPQKKLV